MLGQLHVAPGNGWTHLKGIVKGVVLPPPQKCLLKGHQSQGPAQEHLAPSGRDATDDPFLVGYFEILSHYVFQAILELVVLAGDLNLGSSCFSLPRAQGIF